MSTVRGPDWSTIRERAAAFPEAAFEFVRQGLAYTVDRRELEAHSRGDAAAHAGGVGGPAGGQQWQREAEPGQQCEPTLGSGGGRDRALHESPIGKHVTGRELSIGLRDFAQARYGLLAGAVLRRWGFRRTEDFGVVVYAMIERGEMKASAEDSPEDFRAVYDFDAAFGAG